MDDESVVQAVRALMKTGKKTNTARLRVIFNVIEQAFEAGVSRESMHKTLQEEGFTLSLQSFDNAMHRLRKQNASVSDQIKATKDRAAKPQGFTPKIEGGLEPEDEDEDLANLTKKERRERQANKFIKPEFTNPLIKNLNLKDKS